MSDETSAEQSKGKSKKNEGDEGHFGGKRKFGENVIRSFTAYRLLLLAFGRWPLSHKENPDGTYSYEIIWYKPRGIYFVLITIYFIYLLVGGGVNFAGILLYLTSNDSTFAFLEANGTRETLSMFREGNMVKRHMVVVISIWTNILLTVITSFNVIWKHKYMVNYFSFWTRAVQTMHMDVAKGTGTHAWAFVGTYLFFTSILVIMSIAQFGASPSGVPVVMAMLTFRLFNRNLLTETILDEDIGGVPAVFAVYRILGGIGFLYVFIGAKSYILLFLYKCKLLRNAFASWNGRVYAAILRGGDFTQTKEGRTTFTLLFKDHCVLLDLLEGTNRFFAGVLESYFMLQVAALCFELYVTLRAAKFGHNADQAQREGYFVREYDYVPCFFIFFLNSALLFAVAKSAALVGEEAIAGLEVIRRKTMLGRKTDEELYFMLSMYTSYISYRRMELSAGGYFYINKEFVITIVSTIFSYFIILYQFQPQLDPKAGGLGTGPERDEIGRFFVYIENGRPCSWVGNLTCVPADRNWYEAFRMRSNAAG